MNQYFHSSGNLANNKRMLKNTVKTMVKHHIAVKEC